jgi:hypothetical protein
LKDLGKKREKMQGKEVKMFSWPGFVTAGKYGLPVHFKVFQFGVF